MAVNVGTAYVTLMPSMSGFSGQVSKQFGAEGSKAGRSFGDGLDSGSGAASGFSGKLGALTGVVAGFAGSIASKGIDAILSLSGEMVSASDSAQKFASTLQFSGLDDSAIKQLTASTQEYADKTVYDLGDIRNVTAQLASNGVSNFSQLAEAAGNLNAVAGGNADTFKSVGMVMTQTAGAGKLTTENWNQLADAIPGASGKLQEAMRANGAYTGNFRDAMEKGEITADEFNQAVMQLGMTDVAKEAATSTQTIEGAFGNLQASVVGVGSQAIDAIKPLITGAMSGIAEFISGIPAAIGPIAQALAPLGQQFLTAFQPIATMVTAQLVPALQPLGAALSNLASAVLPVISAAIATVAPILAQIAGGVISLVTSIAAQAVPIINQIAQLVSAAMPAIQNYFSTMGKAVSAVIDATFPLIQSVVTTVMGVIQSVISIVLSAIKGDWSGVWNGIKQLASTVWEGIKSIVSDRINLIKTVISSALGIIQSVWGSIWGAIRGAFSGIWDGIRGAASAGVSAVYDTVIGIKDRVLGFFSGAGSWLWNAGESLMNGLKDGIMGAVGSVTRAVSGAVSRIRDFFPFSPAKVGPFSGRGYTTYSGKALISDWAESISAAEPAAISAASRAAAGVQRELESMSPALSVESVPDASSMVPAAAADGGDVTQAILAALSRMGAVRLDFDAAQMSAYLAPSMDRALGDLDWRTA